MIFSDTQNLDFDAFAVIVFIELAGAGAIGNALAFFQILNIEDNSRVNKSRII